MLESHTSPRCPLFSSTTMIRIFRLILRWQLRCTLTTLSLISSGCAAKYCASNLRQHLPALEQWYSHWILHHICQPAAKRSSGKAPSKTSASSLREDWRRLHKSSMLKIKTLEHTRNSIFSATTPLSPGIGEVRIYNAIVRSQMTYCLGAMNILWFVKNSCVPYLNRFKQKLKYCWVT